jgi:hypothetical protein
MNKLSDICRQSRIIKYGTLPLKGLNKYDSERPGVCLRKLDEKSIKVICLLSQTMKTECVIRSCTNL